MGQRHVFAAGEWYHCYNRGVNKQKVFQSARDYDRFLSLLYVSNATERIHLSDHKHSAFAELSSANLDRGTPLVEFGAWCLMGNHVHFLLKEGDGGGGIARFMQKVFTGYTMYFNKKHERSGPLFSGVFKSAHVHDDRYIKQLVSYIHMNPIEIHYPDWKTGAVSVDRASKVLDSYCYSSLHAFEGVATQYGCLLGDSILEVFEGVPDRKGMLEDAREYYEERNVKVSP